MATQDADVTAEQGALRALPEDEALFVLRGTEKALVVDVYAGPHAAPTLRRLPDSSGDLAAIAAPLRRNARIVVEVAVLASLLGVLGLALRTYVGRPVAPPPIFLTSAKLAEASPSPSPTVTVAAPIVNAPMAGTVRRSTAGRLTLDGVPIAAEVALVPCGPHLVTVGSAPPRTIDVPCGGTIAVGPNPR